MRTRENTCRWAVISLILVITCGGAFANKTIYVDDDAAGANDGSSWPDAYKCLQDALADANSADKPVEIRVAQGIYRPDRIASEPNGTGDRTATFQLISGVALKGGYAGLGQADPNVRDIEACETILSGDLAGNDVDVNDPCDLLNEPTRAENSIHVVTGSGTDESSMLDGFAITGGNASGESFSSDYGGGMYNEYGCSRVISCKFISNSAEKFGGGLHNSLGRLTLTNCIFIGNSAGTSGGGIINWSGIPLLEDCKFYKNSAGGAGGGMANIQSSTHLSSCTFRDNSAKHGGGMANTTCSPFLTLTNCTFMGNSADYGGGMQNVACTPSLTNCGFIGNSANYKGGGMYNRSGRGPFVRSCMFIGNLAEYGAGMWNEWSYPNLSNCTFSVNSATNGNAVACGPKNAAYRSNVKLTNCILWDGGDEIWSNNGSTITVSYSDVQGGQTAVYDPCDGLIWGEGNIDAEPLFADANNGDYHLKSQAGRWDSTSESWVKDDVTSPCINAGDMGSPIGDEPFPNGGIVNMGAYGGTDEASKSYFGEPVCETIIAGDINGDCKVDILDFSILASGWLEDAPAEYDAIIEISVATDKSMYVSGEVVKVLVTAKNPNPEQVTLHFSTDLQAVYLMDETFYWDADKGHLPAITHVTIGPYDSYTWEFGHGTYSKVYPLGVGIHTVAGAVWGYGRSAPVEFEVVSE